MTAAGRKSTAPGPIRRILTPVEQLIRTESFGGSLLIAVALVAFVWANSPWAAGYETMKHATTGIRLGGFVLEKPLELWVNDLLMAVFFFLVGLEIKRELLVGELAGWRRAALPVFGALGGMVAPAAIYAALTRGTPYIDGWGVPMATDIAFAVGVLALLGSRVPLALKVFLLALAIVDDLGAVLVIALFYTPYLDLPMLGLALVAWGVALAYGRLGGGRAAVFLLLGAVLWYAMLKSGVHATIAGVLLALAVPLKRELSPDDVKRALKARIGGSFEQHEVSLRHLEDVVERGSSPLHRFEHALAPWVAFVIMPVFALFNAGVGLQPADDRPLLSIATVAVFLGLLVGKPLGIVGFVWLAERIGLIQRPTGVSWATLAGIGLVAGIGFTMALFVAHLAFGAGPALDQAKIGVLAASVVAAVAGLVVLHLALRPGVTAARP